MIKIIILWLIISVSAISQQYYGNSYVSIKVEPYTIIEVNKNNSIWTFIDDNKVLIENIEVSIRNNTEYLTDLVVRVSELTDSTEIKITVIPIPDENSSVVFQKKESYIDVNPLVIARNISHSKKFLVSYLISTRKYQSIEKVLNTIIWTLQIY